MVVRHNGVGSDSREHWFWFVGFGNWLRHICNGFVSCRCFFVCDLLWFMFFVGLVCVFLVGLV